MKISQTGIDLIKSFEGCRLTAYKAVSTERYYTIGWGHYGADVRAGDVITQAQADEMFLLDIAAYENAVNGLGRSWTQNQFDALTSFCYNCGAGSLNLLCHDRDAPTIADKMLAYNKSGGEVLAGLTRRREAERALFLAEASNYTADEPQSVVGAPDEPHNMSGGCMIFADGSKDEAIKALQTFLNGAGCTDRDDKALTVDGAYGAKTDYALRRYIAAYILNR